jgi:hypothetical protein
VWLWRLRRAARLRPGEIVNTARAAACLLRIAFSLGRQPLPQMLERLGLNAPLPVADSAQIAGALRCVRWAHFLLPLSRNCLLDALAAALFLERRGYAVPLAIGICRKGDELLAHAWLGPENDAPETYRILWRSPAALP